MNFQTFLSQGTNKKKSYPKRSLIMIRNYLKIALRNIVRQKGHAFINIFGLAIGFTCALLIFAWVYDEVTYDRFHENLEQIYRVEQDQFYNGEAYHVTVTPYPAGAGWKKEIPEIEESVRLAWVGNLLFQRGDHSFFENNIQAVDSSLFEVFTFPLKYGDPQTALKKPYSMVLSEELARKYFGDENPLGKVIRVDNQHEFTVTGVLEEIPQNSSIRFQVLIPYDFIRGTDFYRESWGSNSITTAVMLKEGADPGPVDRKLTDVVKSHVLADDDDPEEYQTRFMLAPLKKMHLHSYFGFGHDPGAIKNVYIFSIIGVFILLIAAINYMNLSTARASKRAREIGLRKVTGAYRRHLIGQFYGESIITAIIAALLAVVFVNLLMGPFNQLAGKEIPLNFLASPVFMIGLAAITLLTGLIAGSYPALYLSRFSPIRVMKGELGISSKAWLRKTLVVVQFTLSVFLIVGTILIYKQLRFMQNQKLGYDKEHVVYIKMQGDIKNSYEVIRNAFKQNPEVEHVTAAAHLPSNIGSNGGGVEWEGKDPELRVLVSQGIVEFGYTQTLNIPMVQGRSFDQRYATDRANDSTAAFLINEEMARIMEKENPVGESFSFMGFQDGKIIGVMQDFHFHSMRNSIEPLALAIAYPQYLNFMLMRVKPGPVQQTVEKLEETWKGVMPEYPFNYHFLDAEYDRMYRAEARMGSLLKYFAVMAILIACLGLFGLASFMAENRTKEIGVRKAMGSSSQQIVLLLSKEFSLLVGIAILIAIPASWFYLHRWLQDYAYRTGLEWWIFALAAALAFMIALLTVSYQAIRAARANPSDSLRYE